MNDKKLNQAPPAIKECFLIMDEIMEKQNGSISQEQIEDLKSILMKLLEHIIVGESDRDIQKIIELLQHVIRNMQKDKTKEKDDRDEHIKENELQTQARLVIYELYKIINPKRIAGETELENFINNVQVRGVEAALYYDRAGIAKSFSKRELHKLAQHSDSVMHRINMGGTRGFGKGV